MKLTPAPLRFMFVVCGVLLSVVASTSFGQSGGGNYSLAPGVVVDTATGVAFVMTPKRQVDAVALENGEQIWSTSAAARPIAIRGNRLIGQVESAEADSTLTLVALDLRTGEPKGSQSTNLGAGVVTSIDDGRGRQFLVGTAEAGTASGPVLWRYFEQELRGPDEPPAPPFERFGALSVTETASMTTVSGGGFSRQSGRPPYARPRISRPVSEKPAPDTVILDLDSGLRFRLDGVPVPSPTDGSSSSPTVAESSAATVTVRPPMGGLILTEGGPGEEFPLTRRIPGDQFAYSVDGRHIAASAFAGKIEAAEPYRWTIYERGTFEVVATYLAQTSLAPFVVAEGRVLYLRQPFERREGGKLQSYPPALVARDTGSGRIVWTHDVRDTRYLGPIPNQAK